MVPFFVFSWMRNRRRAKWLDQDLPADWESILQDNVRFFSRMSDEHQKRVRQFVQVFVREKNWEGCGGQIMLDEIKVTVAGFVGVLICGMPVEYFDSVMSILVYPQAYSAPTQTHAGGGVMLEGHSAREGEAWYRGPVILSWADIQADVSAIDTVTTWSFTSSPINSTCSTADT